MIRRLAILLALLVGFAGALAPAAADDRRDGQGKGPSRGEERGRDEDGGTIPLSRAADVCRRDYRGRLIDARLEGNRQYVLLCETRDGRILRIRVDARTGRVLQAEGRN